MRLSKGILSAFIAMSFATASHAAVVGIIDSGVDYKHEVLASKMWNNPNSSTTDDTGKVYKSDKNGWNFADGNNQIIDYKYLGTFSDDCYKIFDVQGKILRGTATEADKEWYNAKKKDEAFLKELGKFGNFVHGTHVSGISSMDSQATTLVGMKLIPTETPGAKLKASLDGGNPIITLLLGQIAKNQAKLLISVGKYTKAVNARVANGSFGTSVNAVKPTVAALVKQFTGKDPTDEETESYSIDLVKAMLKECQGFTSSAPNTLFVFAAGNDGTDNDKLPASPSNIKTGNTISVAATLGTEKLASFSNYGATMVDVAAPGVTIRASIPGSQYIEMSGTSMAAPFVTNVAARIQDENPSLDPAGVRKILIDTVDKKDWLSGKVKSSGIVNDHRAVAAARLSNHMNLDDAIASANRSVSDLEETKSLLDAEMEQDLLVLPLPAFFE